MIKADLIIYWRKSYDATYKPNGKNITSQTNCHRLFGDIVIHLVSQDDSNKF